MPGISGGVINIACGTSTSVNEIVKLLNKILRTNIKSVRAPKRPGDVRTTYASIGKMRRLLKIRHITQFEEGLRLTVGWFRSREK
jgi:nucleoside-diphosphate-sugar epimerase